MDKLFVIAIGGTGMRCLESFVHLCAMGMFDNKSIDILTLDTDQSNGNKGRVEELIDLYSRIKSDDGNNVNGGQPNADTFFSAKLSLFRFYTKYADADRKNYKILSRQNSGTSKGENADLSKLFFDERSVQEFDLSHGYRAQTHLGSLLMYHGIIEAVRNFKQDGNNASTAETDLRTFLERLQECQGGARVFVFGSIFGGTGASSIPIIPVALNDALEIMSDGTKHLDCNSVKFGATLLTNYFAFTSPDNAQKQADRLVAESENFAINCQAALQFYQSDPTVRNTYKSFYHIGWPFAMLDVSGKGHTVTGGKEQKNACHVVELMSACAAYDFFTQKDEQLMGDTAKYFFRTVETEGGHASFKGADFIANGDLFEDKLGALFSFAHIVLSRYEAAWNGVPTAGTRGLLNRFAMQNIHDYDGISMAQARDIDKYFSDYFGYRFNEVGLMDKGWIYQVRDSVLPGRFIFSDAAFKEQLKDMKSISCGHLFVDDKHNWSKLTGVFSKTDNSDEVLVKRLSDGHTRPRPDQNVQTTKERFFAHVHNAISAGQHFGHH